MKTEAKFTYEINELQTFDILYRGDKVIEAQTNEDAVIDLIRILNNSQWANSL